VRATLALCARAPIAASKNARQRPVTTLRVLNIGAIDASPDTLGYFCFDIRQSTSMGAPGSFDSLRRMALSSL